MALAGSGFDLWGSVPPPRRQHGYRRSCLKSFQPMAESVRGAPDRIHQARVFGPRDRPRRAAPPARASQIYGLLSRGANTSVAREGLAHAPTYSGVDGRARGGVRGSRWVAPSVRATGRLTA